MASKRKIVPVSFSVEYEPEYKFISQMKKSGFNTSLFMCQLIREHMQLDKDGKRNSVIRQLIREELTKVQRIPQPAQQVWVPKEDKQEEVGEMPDLEL